MSELPGHRERYISSGSYDVDWGKYTPIKNWKLTEEQEKFCTMFNDLYGKSFDVRCDGKTIVQIMQLGQPFPSNGYDYYLVYVHLI